MPKTPTAWTEDDLVSAITHGLQMEALGRVTKLLIMLRDAKSANDLWTMQGELFNSLIWAQEFRARVKRNLERLRDGKLVKESPESGSWEVEYRIASRVERQIRSVGDCLAWKVLRCRRDVFFVLSQNENPGPMYGKDGLAAELEMANRHWAQGDFTLLNDLTLSVRIGDLIVFAPDGPHLSEVKAGGHEKSKQRQRIRRALEALNRERPLEIAGDPHEIFRPQTQLRTRMDRLAQALTQAAASGGTAFNVIQPGWLLLAGSLRGNQTADVGEKFTLNAMREASIRTDEPHIQGIWSWRAWDYKDPLVGGVPFGAFPLEPLQCAELTCGYAMYRVVLRIDLLERELKRVGLGSHWDLDEKGLLPNKAIVQVFRQTSKGLRGLTVSRSGLNG